MLTRDDSKPCHSFRRGEVSWTPHILPAEADTSQAAGRQAAVHPQPQGHSRRRPQGTPQPAATESLKHKIKGRVTVVVPSLIQVKGAILSSLGNSDNFAQWK